MYKALYLFLFVVSPLISYSQDSNTRVSPLDIATCRYKDTYIKITYSKPSKGGRQIFGKLVPYNQVWRTGANEATEITITHDILINGQNIKSGTYSIFTIPKENTWEVIINSEIGLWGAYNYNTKLDVMRFEVPVQQLTGIIFESFTIKINQRNDIADIMMMWDTVQISIPVKFIN